MSVLNAAGFRPYLPAAGVPEGPEGFEELAEAYRRLDGFALVHGFDAGSVLGRPALTTSRLAEEIAPFSDVLGGLGCVDPHRGAAAVVAAHDALRVGMRGLFFHPAAQQFDPAGRRAAPIWEMADQLRLPVVVHCGATALGAGRPGGAGISLDFADPMRMDRVAARHPGLQIVLTGLSEPWLASALVVAFHKANIHLAPGLEPPDTLPPAFQAAMTGPMAARSMVGSGFPFATPAAWLDAWHAIGAGEQSDRLVLRENAAQLFGL